MNAERLRPLGLGDIFDEGFDLYKRNFVFLLLVTAAAVVPLDILLAFVNPLLMRQIYDLFNVSEDADATGLWLLSAGVKLAIFLPLYAVALAPLVIAASARYLQREGGIWTTMQPVLCRLPGLLFCYLLTGIVLDMGIGLCLIGWPIAASLLLFTPQAFLLEKMGPGKAISRSISLINGYGGRIFSCLLMLGVLLWAVGLGIKLPLAFVFETALKLSPPLGSHIGGVSPQTSTLQVVSLLSGGLTHLLLFPFLVSVLTALYYDIRIRKEGFDIDLLANELGYPPLSALRNFLPPVPTFSPFRPVAPPPLPPKPGTGGILR